MDKNSRNRPIGPAPEVPEKSDKEQPEPPKPAPPAYQFTRLSDGVSLTFTSEEFSVILQTVARNVALNNAATCEFLYKLMALMRTV